MSLLDTSISASNTSGTLSQQYRFSPYLTDTFQRLIIGSDITTGIFTSQNGGNQ